MEVILRYYNQVKEKYDYKIVKTFGPSLTEKFTQTERIYDACTITGGIRAIAKKPFYPISPRIVFLVKK